MKKFVFKISLLTKMVFAFSISIFSLQNAFAWGYAVRDVSRQASENPTYYLGDQCTLYWYVDATGSPSSR